MPPTGVDVFGDLGEFTPDMAARIERRMFEVSLYKYAEAAWRLVEPKTNFKHNWHLGAISEHLQAVTAGEIRNIVINMPPRHCKSLLACVFWPSWMWTRLPHLRFLFSSYSEGLALRDATRARELIASQWYQDRWGGQFAMKPGQDTKSRYVNDQGGHRITTSVGGRGTGEGGDILVVDDPHKINEIESDSIREQVIDWWDQVMGTRGNDPQTVRRVIIMQRLSEVDLSGHVLCQDLGYDHLCLPCHHDPDRIVYSFPPETSPAKMRETSPDLIFPTRLQLAKPHLRDPRTEKDELLWPAHFGEPEVQALKTTLGPWGAASQLDQKPTPKGSGALNRGNFRYFTETVDVVDGVPVRYFLLLQPDGKRKRVRADDCRWFQTIDTAMGEAQENDPTAVGTFCQTPDNELLVYEVEAERVSVPKQLGFILARRLRYPQLLYQAVESKASGIGILQSGKLQGTPFRELKADADKMTRAAPVATMYENGMVYHHAGADWLMEFENQVTKFPKGRHDDMVDVLAYAGILSTTDALLRQAGGTADFLMYPTEADLHPPEPEAAALLDRYDILYEGWGDDDGDTVYGL